MSRISTISGSVLACDRGPSAFVELLAHGGVVQFAAVDIGLGGFGGSLAVERPLDGRIIGAEFFPHELQRLGERGHVKRAIDGNGGEQLLFERGQTRFGVFAQALRIRLLLLGGDAHQGARILRQCGVEAKAALDKRVGEKELLANLDGLGNFVPRRGVGGV